MIIGSSESVESRVGVYSVITALSLKPNSQLKNNTGKTIGTGNNKFQPIKNGVFWEPIYGPEKIKNSINTYLLTFVIFSFQEL